MKDNDSNGKIEVFSTRWNCRWHRLLKHLQECKLVQGSAAGLVYMFRNDEFQQQYITPFLKKLKK